MQRNHIALAEEYFQIDAPVNKHIHAKRAGQFLHFPADGAVADNQQKPKPFPKSIASVGSSLTWRPSEGLFARVTYAEALRGAPIVGDRHLQDKGFQFRITIWPLKLFR